MDQARLLQIANRIHLLLLRELQQGIDVRRMLDDARYARDVLLVCDAMPGSDLASLAQHFRAASGPATGAPPAAGQRDGPPAASGPDSTGFGGSGFGGSRFGSDGPGFTALGPAGADHWLAPLRRH